MDEKFEPYIEEKPPLYDIVDKAFHVVADVKVKDNYLVQDKVMKNPALSARIFAGVGTGVSIGLAHLVSKTWMPNFYENTFQTVEELCLYGMMMLSAYYADTMVKCSGKHPVYVAGMETAAATSMILAAADLIIR